MDDEISCSSASGSDSYFASSQPRRDMPVESSLGESNTATCFSQRTRLTLAVVQARTKSRTQYALQVLAASKAALDATDALIAASDALLAAPRDINSNSSYEYSLQSPKKQNDSNQNAVALPEACEASDSSESESQEEPLVEEGVVPQTPGPQIQTTSQSFPPKTTVSNENTQVAQASYAHASCSEEEEESSGGEDDSSEEDSLSQEEATGSKSTTNIMSVELLLKGNVTEPVISGSVMSGSFEKKAPIPKFITSGEAATSTTHAGDELTAVSMVDNKQTEDDSSDSSSSEDSSQSSSSESATVPSATAGSQSTTTATDVEEDAYVEELLEELGRRPPQTPFHRPSLLQAPKPPLHQVQRQVPPKIQGVPPILSPAQPKITSQPQSTGTISDYHAEPNQQAGHGDSSQEDSTSTDASQEESDGSSSAEAMDESDTGRPSASDKPSESSSSDVEEDDYVEELLSELKQTKGGVSSMLPSPTPQLPPQIGATKSLLLAKPNVLAAQSVATATTASATIVTASPTPKSALRKPAGMQKNEAEDDSAGDADDESSDEDSIEGSSVLSSTADDGEEDDEYVDELLNELNATKTSFLLPPQKIRTSEPAFGAPSKDTIAPECDDEVSDASSSEYDSSDDSGLFSDTDGEDDSLESSDEGDARTLNYASSDDYTSDGEDDEYVDDLLHELQAPRTAAPKPQPDPAAPPPIPGGGFPQPPPGMAAMGLPGLPGEGLNLDAIRSELEKVGRAVMTQKSGEAFVARAQILASINQLSSHVPNCVLDFLGKEIRARMKWKKEKAARKEEGLKEPRKHKVIDVASVDDMSEVSDLSDENLSSGEDDSNVEFVDTSAVNLDGEGEDKKQVSRGLMRMKSEEALDEMFKKSRDDGSLNRSMGELSEDIDNIFNSSNDYGLTKNKRSGSLASFGSMESSTGSTSLSRGFNKFMGKSRAGSAASVSWGTNTEGKLPSVSRFECALLFVDISGFTKLSTLLDPETLSKVINSYFQLIVSKIYEFNGDIQKFAGDAIFAEWRCSDENPMEFCVAAATACASQIVDECSDFPVMAGGAQSRTGEPISSLNVHCALGAGQMIGIHVGDNARRREYLFLGEPIDQLTWGADLAKHGELVVSPEAFRSLSLAGVLDFNIRPSESEPAIIAKRSVTMFKSEFLKDYRVSRAEYAKSRGVTGHVEGLEVEDLKLYQQLMALYVHPVVANIHFDEKSKMKSKSSAQERHREEAELRRVYIMFIHPLIAISEENDYAVDLLNEIMNLTSTQLERYCGHLRQMIVDDKGLVLIGTFGLRGSTFPNMVAERALPATIALHNALQSQLGVDNRIGATFGEVYCGAVGGVKRHEYAVLGPSANLAARLMGSKNNPGILVECNIRRMASRKYAFNALPPVKAKGYSEPVPIFEPLSPLERSWGRIQPNFVGREQEIKALMGMARDIVSVPKPHSRLVFVASQSGMGKSTMVAHAIEHIRNLIGDDTRRLVITKHVGKESHSLLPFGMFRSILLDVLANFAASTDDKSHVSGVSGFTSQSLSLQSLSCRSQGSSTALSLAKSEELLKVLCRELNAPSGFVDHVLHHLSGSGSGKSLVSGKAPSMKSMVSFMDRAFRRCTDETKLVVVALDDVQYIDEMTWKVLRQVFEGCENVLMICAFDLSRSRDLKVEADFWQVLNQKYRPSGHFVPMELGGLGKEEITIMTMKTLGLQREDISHDLLNEVLIQSGGMPHFANEFLELVKRRQFNEMMDGRAVGGSFKPKAAEATVIGPNALGSVPEIILHRIDSFDVAVRNILNIAAVLGKSFTLKEVIAVLKENHDMREDLLEKEATASLESAVNEGILRKEEQQETEDDGDNSRDSGEKANNIVFSFYHSIWQSTILSLMLDARKMDVHKKIALSMEKEKERDGSDFAFQMKLLGHWKCSGNTTKLTDLALEVGKHFEQKLAMPTQSIRVYEEALDAWKSDKPSDRAGGIIISPEALHSTEPEELQHISALHVALGRAFNGAQRNADSALCFHDALRILRVPKSAAKVTDRSAAFPAYFGLYECVKAKQIVEEDGKRYEQLLIKKFLEDTKHHPEKHHHVHAITCQMDLYQRSGDMTKAVGIQKVLYNVYDHVEHSKKLQETYGSDEAALSFSNSAMWHWQMGDKEAALNACRHVIGKLMPKTDRSDVHQSFVMMYPVVLVMKDTGVAVQARKHFDRLVVKPFSAFFGEGKSSFFLPVYEPIMMLLHLVGAPDLDEDTLEEYAEWALDRDRLSFGTLANRRLAVLGRCADSLSAEICFLLAERIDDEETRHILTEHGKEIGQEALIFNTEQGLKFAEQQVKTLLERYASLMGELDRNSDDEVSQGEDFSAAGTMAVAMGAAAEEEEEAQVARPRPPLCCPLPQVKQPSLQQSGERAAAGDDEKGSELVGPEEEDSSQDSSEGDSSDDDSSDFDSSEGDSSDDSEES